MSASLLKLFQLCGAVVDNLPVVAPEKQDKLQALLKKIFSQLGTIRDRESARVL